jgi:hypothetical protein
VKSSIFNIVFFAAVLLFFGACESLPFDYYRSTSWSALEAGNGTGRTMGTLIPVHLAAVSVDRNGGWASVEKEIRGLAPLFFLKQGYRVVSLDERADYTADIRVREREYAWGWRTKRSLAVEVRLWPAGDGAPDHQDLGIASRLPLTAGQAISLGNRSFSSSETSGRMLALAIKKAVRPLRKKSVPVRTGEGR